MGANDMHVVMYKILAYLYDCMKRGIEPQQSAIAADSPMIGPIPYRYWCSIMSQLVNRGLIEGVSVAWYDNEQSVIVANPTVTLEGVEFMQENSMMRKALDFIKEAKSTLPFV